MGKRHALTDEQWRKLKEVIPVHPGRSGEQRDRNFIDAVLYRTKTGIQWADLPERFGPYKTIYNRFRQWAQRGWWERIFQSLQVKVDKEGFSIVDATVVRAHQDASGAKGGSNAMR